MATEKLVGQQSLDLVVKEVYGDIKKKADKETTYTKNEVNNMIGKLTNVFQADKTDFSTQDTKVISDYFGSHADPAAKKGDIFLIRTYVEEKDYGLSSYIYNGTQWLAITGNVDAESVILRKDITLAGNYTQVGNITKGASETKVLSVKGKNLKEFFDEIFTVRLQPANPTQPAVQGFTLNGAKAVEAGTKITSAQTTAASLTAGSYQFGPNTGVVAQSWKIDRVTNVSDLNKTVATANTVNDTNDGKGFIIGDQGGANVVNSLKYTATATHNEGAIAHDNLGENSNPPKKIDKGTKAATTAAYTPFRNYFYGSTATGDLSGTPVNSAYIRALTKSNKAYTKGEFMLNVKPGDTRVVIACVATATGVTKVINTSALNADVTATFKKSTVKVEGAEGYTAIDYNVWVFEPAEAYGQKADLKVTLG